MATPAVSVCIPTFNAARHIRETVHSVLDQTFTDFELVICDDASTDDTINILHNIVDSRIRILPNPGNTGLAPNWNRAVRECLAPFVKLLCQDDLIYPTCLENQFGVLSNPTYADIGLVSARRDIIDDTGRVLFHSNERRRLYENFFAEASGDMRLRSAMFARRVAYLDSLLKRIHELNSTVSAATPG